MDARAIRMAAELASEPVFPKRTRSAPGTCATTRSAISTSIGWGSVKEIPSASCRSIAAFTLGHACPRITGPSAIGKST